jgi:hypothetical protein
MFLTISNASTSLPSASNLRVSLILFLASSILTVLSLIS